jgi:hypothetical protein
MDDAQTQLVDKLKTANSILVTVSRNPSVDQLSALLGLTLALNKQGKHAAAVFSGNIPSTLEFLQPEETFEKNTDSLRDFIIALDKNKADKLRYKVEDNVVRIFITPYKTSITQDDFEFTQGDFNIDLVVAIGVKQQEDLDEAIMAHGRILHDAVVASINTSPDGGLGSISWHDTSASSLSELVTRIVPGLGDNLLDEQIATALLTGIVAETNRFSNEKTSSETMSASATLMAAGANQQLVASKLETPEELGVNLKDNSAQNDDGEPKNDDGSIAIDHKEEPTQTEEPAEEEAALELPTPSAEELPSEQAEQASDSGVSEGSRLVTEPPTMGGVLTANSHEEQLDPVTDPLSMPKEEEPHLLDHQPEPPTSAPEPAGAEETAQAFTPPPPAWVPPASDPLNLAQADSGSPAIGAQPAPEPAPAPAPPPPESEEEEKSEKTLADIEQSVETAPKEEGGLDTARDEVNKALNGADSEETAPQEPVQALNAMPLQLNPSDLPSDPGAPAVTAPQEPVPESTAPPVPPPIPFQFGNPQSNITDQP